MSPEALRRHHLEDVAGEDVLLRLVDHGVEALASGVRGRHGQFFDLVGRGAAIGQAAPEVGDHVGQSLARLIKGSAGIHAEVGPRRGDDGDLVGDGIEHGDYRRAHEHAVGNVEHVGIVVGDALDKAYRVVGHVADQSRGHWRHLGRQVDPGFGDHRAQRVEGAGALGNGARLERVGIEPGLAVDLGAVAEAAPDQVRFQADERVSAAYGAALDRLEEEAVGPAIGELEHRRHRGFQIGNQRRPHDLGPAVLVGGLEVRESGAHLHRAGLSRVRRRPGC